MTADDKITLIEALALAEDGKLSRAADAAERAAGLLERLADASERQAAALEALTALFASCIGVTHTWCPGRAEGESPSVNFLRASADGKPFKCDHTAEADDE